jgi:UPF0176 protein
MSDLNIKNVSFYTFFKPDMDLEKTRTVLLDGMLGLNIKGSILLAPEGVNCSLSGETAAMDRFLGFLFKIIGVIDPAVKVSYSQEAAFKRSRVKVKPCIVPKPGLTPIDPAKDSAPYISPEEFHQWIRDKKKMVVLDTRNDFEFQVGRFKDALHLGTRHFADFENDLGKAPGEWHNMPVVTFCTGGIRCEKAAPLMLKKGFREVYQLDGGILNYFKKVGRDYFEGECFVFDERVSVRSSE